MESVYFGKENNENTAKADQKSPLTPYMTGTTEQESAEEYTKVYTKEYFFPDENNIKLRTESFLSKLFGSALLDFFVLCIILPVAYVNLYLSSPVLYFAEKQVVYTSSVSLVYVTVFLLLYLLIHNSFRRKIYVLDGKNLYVIRHTVRVKTWKKGLFSTADDADKRIHDRYVSYMASADSRISGKSHRVKKILTSVTESGDINDKGRLFSGFNEKNMRDEDVLIPNHYKKFDPSQSYFTKRPLRGFIFILLKLALYGACIYFILCAGIKKTEVYNRDIGAFTDSKTAVLEPLGFEREVRYIPGNSYHYIDYVDTSDSYLKNSVRIYFKVTEDGVKFDGSFIGYDLYYGDDTSKIIRVMNELYDFDIRETADIDSMIAEYAGNNGEEIKTSITTDMYDIYVYVHESYYADYNVSVYVTSRYVDPFN